MLAKRYLSALAGLAQPLAKLPRFEQGIIALGDARAELARAGIELATGPAMVLSTAEHGCDAFYAAILERAR